MKKNIFAFVILVLFVQSISSKLCFAAVTFDSYRRPLQIRSSITDTVPPEGVLAVIKKVVYSINKFNIEDVADLYTPNALVADDEPPYSWNGPTAGVQWINAVEQTSKQLKLSKLEGSIRSINVFQQSADNVYIIVPVTYTGVYQGETSFTARGAFTFVLRMINNKWMIKSQVWMPEKGL